jgi:hypothetical protein
LKNQEEVPWMKQARRMAFIHALFSSFLNITSRFVGVPLSETIGGWIGIDPLRTWYYNAIKVKASNSGTLTYYEFGVGRKTTLRFLDALKAYCRETKDDVYKYHMYFFDSFQGLPPKEGIRDDNPDWGEGVFLHTLTELNNAITRSGLLPNKGNIHIVKGFYRDTLTPELAKELFTHPPSIIVIDVDYYSSCKTLLEWLRPLLKEGTLFYFDNIWYFWGNSERGELAAINEFNEKREGQLVPFHLSPKIASQTYAFVETT